MAFEFIELSKGVAARICGDDLGLVKAAASDAPSQVVTADYSGGFAVDVA
jgi:hypothetical protein